MNRETVANYLGVALGSGLGTGARYLVSLISLSVFGPAFPWGTLAVNLVGSALIAWFATRASALQSSWIARWQPFLIAGFCGGFTTFSLFSLETLQLWQQSNGLTALVYAVGSPLLWLAAAWAGQRLARRQMTSTRLGES
ncbi:fluoride efflux transporter CrcB [Halomonas sp. Bachu 37]|uniref:fluoride efflux transporter CrcB n=1 Tax=Halomonas kashgarensis TaxID=3084920 RepID=UPI003217B8FA